jgi:branched-chain amino acid transport system permease protein
MVRREIQRFCIYTLFLTILVLPMVGMRGPEFEARRAFTVLSVLVGVLLLTTVFRLLRETSFYRNLGQRIRQRRDRALGKIQVLPRPVALGSLFFLLALFPFAANNYVIDVAITVLIYVTLGLGLNVVVGLAGLLDLGYIAFYAVGAYTYSLLNLHYGIPFWFALPFGVVIGSLCGCIIGYPTLKMRGDYLAIVTLGFGEIIRLVLNNWDNLTKGPNGLLGMDKPKLILPSFSDGGLSWTVVPLKSLPSLYFVILAVALLTVIAVHRLNNSRIGRAWIAIREDETAAELTGIPTTLLKLLAYALGAVFAAVAGAFFAAKLSYTNPNFFVFLESCVVLSIVVLGGMGSIPGIILGALALIAIPELFRELASYRMLAFGGAMTVMMVLKPEGFIPATRRKRELHEEELESEEAADE